jgi:multidrug efflux pump subunit AcrA (membrane-fusion protein)
MKYDPIEQARLIYEAQPTAYNASAYQVAMQLAALKAELEQDRKQLQAELKAAKAHLAYAERMAEQYKWQPIDTAPVEFKEPVND